MKTDDVIGLVFFIFILTLVGTIGYYNFKEAEESTEPTIQTDTLYMVPPSCEIGGPMTTPIDSMNLYWTTCPKGVELR